MAIALGSLHPGCAIALKKLKLDELGIAEAIRDGELVSPQHYANITMFAMRITGVGLSYRDALNEHVWRSPDLYMNDRFLKRIAALPVIVEHPDGGQSAMTSRDFKERIAGSVYLPFLRPPDGVWAVCKIWDENAAELLSNEQLSTSPAVVFRDPTVNETHDLPDGSTFLIEGKPSLCDHLALCIAGVWDRGGPPTGIESIEAQDMAEETEAEKTAREDAARRDAELMEALKGATQKLDSMHTRMDSLERKMDDDDRRKRADDDARKFSARRDDDDDDKHRARRDAEERNMEGEFEKEGEKKEDARRRAHDARMRRDDDDKRRADDDRRRRDDDDARKRADDDARRRADDDAKHFSARRDDDDDDKAKGRRDAEEKSLAERLEGEGEKKEDAARRARDARKRRDDDDRRRMDDDRRRRADDDDRSRKDAIAGLKDENQSLRTRLEAMEARLPRELSRDDQDALASAQARGDSVAAMFGERVPPPLAGEDPTSYRRRLAQRFQKHSADYKDVDLSGINATILQAVEPKIYADAQAEGKKTNGSKVGVLIPVTTREHGREVTRYTGDPLAWMAPFMRGGTTGRFNRMESSREYS